jgi:exonuclease V
MSGSLSESPLKNSVPEIPIEIVSEEEMALIEAALSAARSSIPAIRPPFDFHRNARSIQSITVLSKRSFSGHTEVDIEDSGDFANTQKKGKEAVPLLHRFRRNKGLSVTDITATVLNIFS